ncbi:PDZ domain-containing protein 8-like isoform X2 [Penaeus chinensis]|uniref:PDZ domain-containing protein 8-like isoform X2 n=1 Tax=Penaeus chinensis TaxID=139456 RepID=UPI001FB6A5DF|nr:PDZ domain-containing protein 8-like isoform X2 [Penaeus chinensis]
MLGAFLWNLFIFASGAISILISAWWWITTQEELPPEPKRRPVVNSSLPEDLAEKLRADSYHKRETCFALNLILQFFFQEKRYESGILRWVTNQLTLEFNELLKHKALSKVIHNMQIRDLNLGTNFPVIKAVTAKHVNLNPDTSVLEQIDILVEVEYNGGIQLAVDASSRLSKAAMVKIKVVHLSGNGRLQFSRHPFTHWSFSFFEEPQVEFEVYSSLGLHIPRFNSIITSQLKGILKRKHTLPYFKLRGPPLIKRPLQPTNEEGCSVPPGRLTGAVVKCSRLQTALIGEVMYCTVILCEVPIVCAVEKPSGVWAILDLTLKRPHGSSAGILLHNADEGVQMVESVTQCSPAHAAGLKKNDILLAVNGTYLHSGHQAAKLFTTNNINGDSNSILLRVKRLILPESKKMVAEQRAVGSDGATTVVGEDTTGRPQVTSCGQPVVSPCTASSSYSGDKSSSAWVESSSSGTSGCGGSGDGTARGGAGLSRSCGVGSISRGGGVGRAGGGGNETSSASSGTSGGYYVNVGSCSRGVGGSYRGADYPSASSCVGSGGVGMYVGSSSGGTEDEGVLGGSRAVSPSHLLAGLMGSLNGSRPAKHRSLPGSPVLQRTSRNRVNSTRDGEISGSGRSTPDSSHNSSPELKRKLLDLHTLTVDSKPTVPGQDKSPVAASVNKTVPRPVIGVGPDKSPGPGVGGQSFGLSQSGVEKPPSNQSSKAGTPTSPDSLMGLSNLEKRGGRRYMGKSKTHLKSIQTPFVDGNREPMFESDFEFWLEEENKYLSIAIWSRNITSVKPDEDFGFKDNKDKAKTKENEKDRRKQKESEKAKAREEVLAGLTEDTLVGYSNLPLISLIPETTLNTQGHVTKILTLNPPHPKCPEMISDSLLAHKGFDMKLCYGDVMLSLTYQPQDRCETLGRGILDKNYASSPISEDESLTDGTLSEEDEISVTQEIVEDRNHDFKRTHFHSATHCDFCRKKIWLKDAYQCGECGIICHKKCMVRCEQETVCASSGLRYRDPSRNEPHDARDVKEMPEIVTTAAVGSADNGSPGNTPPVSPHASLSEGANPFVIDTDEGDTVGSVLDRLLLFPHDERLVTLARESAKDLHSVLPGAERRERINLTLLQLQDAVDREGEVRVDLARQEREAGDAGDALTRASVALQISQCDARTQALALLTLHYCTALQYCTDDVQEGEGEDQIQDVNDEEKKAKGKEKQAEG